MRCAPPLLSLVSTHSTSLGHNLSRSEAVDRAEPGWAQGETTEGS